MQHCEKCHRILGKNHICGFAQKCDTCHQFVGKKQHICISTKNCSICGCYLKRNGKHVCHINIPPQHTKELNDRISKTLKKLYADGVLVSPMKGKKSGTMRICLTCEKSFYQNKKSKRIYCSKKCYGKSIRKKRSGENAPNWIGNLTKNELENLYLNQNKTISEIAKLKGWGTWVIRKRMKLWGIQQRPFNQSVSIGINKNIDKFRNVSLGNKNPMFGKIAYPKLRFVNELGHSVRSSWEEFVGLNLKQNNIPYTYEGLTIKVNGGQETYTADFVLNNNILVEVKGPLFDRQRQKMVEVAKNYKLVIITSKKSFKRYDFSFTKNIFFIDELDKFGEWLKNEIRQSN